MRPARRSFREDTTGEWAFEIVSEAAQGRTAHDNVDELQNFIKRMPNRRLPPARLPPGSGQGMLAKTGGQLVRGASGLMRSLSGRRLPVDVSDAAPPVVMAAAVPMGQPVQMMPQGGAPPYVPGPTGRTVSGRL